MPIEAALRLLANKAVAYTSDTDLREFLRQYTRSETMQILDGVEGLFSGQIKAAAKALQSAVLKIPLLFQEWEQSDRAEYKALYNKFAATLHSCIQGAKTGFFSSGDGDLKIKAVQILSCAFIAKSAVLNRPEAIACDLTEQVEELMDIPIVANDFKIFIGVAKAGDSDIKAARKRLREVL